jgi:hypothetical protein
VAFSNQQRDAVLGFVREVRQRSERYSESAKRKMPRYYELWRGYYTGTAASSKNDVHLPLIFSTIQTDIARKMATSFGQRPFINFVGYGPDDASVARKHDALFDAQFRDARGIQKEYLTHLRADLYGRAVSRVMFQHKEEIHTRTEWTQLPLSGERVRQIMRAKVTTFDGPNHEPVDLLDCFPWPGFQFEEDMPGYAVRYYMTIEEAEYMASEAGGKAFDASEIARIKRDQAESAFRQDEALIKRFEARTGWSDSAMNSKHCPMLEIIEYYGYAPRGLVPGVSKAIITTANNEKYLLRAKDLPYAHRQIPIISTSPTPDPHYYWAPGKAEVAEKMQIVGNKFLNMQLDGAEITVHPMMVYDRRKMVNTRALVSGPGRIFGVDGPPGDALMPVPFDMRGLGMAANQVAQMWQFMQMGSGIVDDAVMGMAGGSGSDRQTAREFVGRREAAGTRLMLESIMYEASYLERLADMYASLNAQFLEVPRQVLILGDNASTDPVSGDPIPATRETIHGWDLGTQYTARAMGSASSITKSAKQQNDLTMFQILAGAQPMVAGAINMVNFLRQMLRNLDYQNVNELVRKVPQVQDMMESNGFSDISQVPETDPSAGMMAPVAGGEGPAIAGMMA